MAHQITMRGPSRPPRTSQRSSSAAAPPHQCPKTISSGTPVGGTRIRTSQTDHRAGRAGGYCYSVFAVDTAGQASIPVARERRST